MILKKPLPLLLAFLSASLFAAEPPPVRIMPLGDSNTLGYSVPIYFSGYRDLLYALLTDAGYTVDFVGTQIDTHNPAIPDPHHQGHSGFRIDQIDSGLDGWLGGIADPDVVLLMIGTNDFLQGFQTAQAPNRLDSLIGHIATARPYAKILVASIVPNTTSSSINTAQNSFNATIPGIVNNHVLLGRDVYFVDVNAAVTPADMSVDGVHPNEAGYDKIANTWFDAISSVIGPYGDDDPPEIVGLDLVDLQHLAITFNKPLEDAAANPAFFSLDGGATVTAASLDSASKRIISLTTSTLDRGKNYTLSITGVRDRTPAHHPIAPGSTIDFVSPLVINGSFESDYAGWSPTGNQEIKSGEPYVPFHAQKMAAFNTGQSTPNGTLSQVLPTIAGQVYRLQFALGVLAFNKNQQRLLCTVQGTGGTTLLSQLVTLAGQGGGTTVWSPQTFTFVANGASATLIFQDVSTTSNSIDLLVDHVRVDRQASYSLAVSSSPASGVAITTSPSDINGSAGGSTDFTRIYNAGTVVTLTAPPSAAGNPFLEWRENGATFSGSTAINVTMNANRAFTAVYSVPAGGPTITAPPQSVTAAVGASVTFSVAASPGPLTYQWRFNGDNIPGANASSYTIGSIQTTNAGSYSVLVGNAGGSTLSASAVLTVIPSGVIANGSFESDYTAWTSGGNQVIYDQPPYSSTDGQKIVVFNGGQTTPNGSVSQRIATVPGRLYTVEFDYGALAFNTQQQRIRIVAQGDTTLLNQIATVTGLGNGTTRWLTASYVFTADSPTTLLTFTDVSTTSQNIDLVLDNVRISTSVPQILAIASTGASAVAIEVSPLDSEGDGNGVTPFTRTYSAGSLVNLEAPFTAGGNAFQKWRRDGADYSSSPSIQIAIDGDHTLTAVYVPSAPFTNGSFESDYEGWSASGNHIIVSDPPYIGTDGDKVMVFNGGSTTANAVLGQSFATTPGQFYAIQFDFGALAFNTNLQRLQVVVQGATTLVDQTFQVAGIGGGAINWSSGVVSFTANSPITTLTFTDISPATASIDLLLDNVRLTTPAAHTLTITKSAGSPITVNVAPADLNGAGNGTTPFTRVFGEDTTIQLIAPPASGSASFQHWELDGVEYSTSNAINLVLDADRTLNAVYATATPFSNGSFEDDFAGWSADGNVITYGDPPYVPSDGSKMLVFNGAETTPSGIVSQIFATTPGQTNVLQFDLGVIATNTNLQRLRVRIVGNGVLLDETISLAGLGNGSIRWAPQSFTFTADSDVTTLSFADLSTNTSAIDLLLDNVRITTAIRTLTVNSSPVAGVEIVLSPADLLDQGDGVSSFTRTFLDATVVTLTAPASVYGANFQRWRLNGADYSTNRTVDVTMNGNHTLTAVYQSSPAFANGSFESNLNSWTTSGNQVIVSGSPYTATHGTKLLRYNGGQTTPNGVTTQTFATIPGQTYTLRYDVGAHGANTSAQRLQVTVQGIATHLTHVASVNGLANGTVRWVGQTHTFTADSINTTLRFEDVSTTTNSIDLLLDNVRITTP